MVIQLLNWEIMLLLSSLHLKSGVKLASILVIDFFFPSATVLISLLYPPPVSSPASLGDVLLSLHTAAKCVFTLSSHVNRGRTLLHSIQSTSPAHFNQLLTSSFIKLYFTPSSFPSSSPQLLPSVPPLSSSLSSSLSFSPQLLHSAPPSAPPLSSSILHLSTLFTPIVNIIYF